ncbi:hypothetical protein [Micromonospora sp. IBHARD004]
MPKVFGFAGAGAGAGAGAEVVGAVGLAAALDAPSPASCSR